MPRLTRSIKDRICQRYEHKLLCRKIRLAEVPTYIRHDMEYCRGIYIKAFRADRCVSKEQYMADLTFMEMELLLTEFDPALEAALRRIYAEMKDNLALFDTHDPRRFH